MSTPNPIDTSTWCLPKRERPAKPFSEEAYQRVGLSQALINPEPARQPAHSPSLDTSGWYLPQKPLEEAEREMDRDVRQLDIAAKKRSKAAHKPRDDRGKPLLFAGKGVLPEDVRTRMRQLAGLEPVSHDECVTWDPRRRPSEKLLAEAESAVLNRASPEDRPVKPPKAESRLSDEQRTLAGLTPRQSLPRPVHDAGAVRTGLHEGILDDHSETGKEYVNRILKESAWFLKDYGALGLGPINPFWETPGARAPLGRKGPWQGSQSEPEHPTDQPHPKDFRPSKDELPPEDGSEDEPEDEPEDKEPEDEEEAIVWSYPSLGAMEERGRGDDGGAAGSALRGAGGALKRLGARMSGGTAASRASKEKVKTAISTHLKAFAKKHGIKYGKKDDDDAPAKPKAPGAKRSPAIKAARPRPAKSLVKRTVRK